MIAKLFRSYSTNFLHHKNTFRDHDSRCGAVAIHDSSVVQLQYMVPGVVQLG
jgi:hypothetical protein